MVVGCFEAPMLKNPPVLALPQYEILVRGNYSFVSSGKKKRYTT
jgi:hypothetical protein